MQELWSSGSYEPHLLSLPLAFAPAAMLIVIAYVLVMRGEPALRLWMLLHFAALVPYPFAVMLAASITSPAAADTLFHIAAAGIPVAAAAGAGFQLRLLGRHRQLRWFVWTALALGVVWLLLTVFTDAAIRGVQRLPGGVWFPVAGPWAWLVLLVTLVISVPGFTLMTLAALRMKPSDERRQLRLVLVANFVTYSGLTDVLLGYGIGVFPLGWLVSGIGSLLVVRALVVEDLLRARAIDTTAPQLVLHLAGAIVLGWVTVDLLGDTLAWWGIPVVLVVCFASVRVTLAVMGLVNRGARAVEGTLDRLVAQLVSRARGTRTEAECAKLAVDIVELGLGIRIGVLIAAAEDWGFTTPDGKRVDDAVAPDPLIVGWLVEQHGALFADELELRAPEDVRELVMQTFERQAARTLIPVANGDELLAILVVPAAVKRQRGRALAFLERIGERLGEVIVHTRMARRAEHRAMLAREVELAATVQQQLLPGRGPHVHGDFTVVGSWLPATRCAGDFWGVYPLGEGRLLVTIGDVTGHGVASATVTAAASAACAVAVRQLGGQLALPDLVSALDLAVRRTGGGELAMTCFAAILDATRREIEFVSCGHTTPYLCRPAEGGGLELLALVGRGNPLGSVAPQAPKLQQKPMRAGDLVVWYTDGVIDAQDAAGEPFGDRRLQRMLKKLDRARLSPGAVHDLVFASVAAHRGGRARGDDETLVVGQWNPEGPR
jgi:serine phosphatase RsbU (regulator of sigma subunit)